MPVESKSATGVAMVLIPPGEGIDMPFLMGKYEVTQGEWEKVMGSNPSSFSMTGKDKDKVAGMETSRFPVENVSWFDCVAFCNMLSEKEGLKPYYAWKVLKEANGTISNAEVQILGSNGYHLPTDAEWTWGCAARARTKFHFGSDEEDLPAYAWFDKNCDGRTHLVGQKRPNAFGLYDFHGNVNEWTEEMQTKADGVPWRVPRGGSWLSTAALCAVDPRLRYPPAHRHNTAGLRLARVP